MADRAVGPDLDIVLLDQFCSECHLVGRGLIRHAKNLIPRANICRGVTMAIQTKAHLQGLGFGRQGHLVNLPVTRYASNPFSNMDAVIEINKIGERVDAIPGDGGTISEAIANGGEYRALSPDLGVAIHADFGRRKTGKSRGLDSSVAVAAIDAIVEYMVFVAEWHRLVNKRPDSRRIRGADK